VSSKKCPHDDGDHLDHDERGRSIVVCNTCGETLATGELPD